MAKRQTNANAICLPLGCSFFLPVPTQWVAEIAPHKNVVTLFPRGNPLEVVHCQSYHKLFSILCLSEFSFILGSITTVCWLFAGGLSLAQSFHASRPGSHEFQLRPRLLHAVRDKLAAERPEARSGKDEISAVANQVTPPPPQLVVWGIEPKWESTASPPNHQSAPPIGGKLTKSGFDN